MVQTATWTTYRVPNSLLSDTEESVVGTEFHQEAIGALADMLRDVAIRRGATWGVCEQIALIGLRHEDGTDYDPKPDVMALKRPLPRGNMPSIHLRDAGVPLFIAEVASSSTKVQDQGDKRHAYAAIGIPEYVVFDPAGDVLTVQLLAWRLVAGRYVTWDADAQGWWHSTSLGVSFRATQPFLGVRDRDGTVIEPSGEMRRRARELEAHQRYWEEQYRKLEGQYREQYRGLEGQYRELTERLHEEIGQRADLEKRLAEIEARLGRLPDQPDGEDGGAG